MAKPTSLKNKLVPVVAATGIAILGWWAWDGLSDSGPGAGFVSGNGRIEATEVDVATKLPGPGRGNPGARRRLRPLGAAARADATRLARCATQ